MTTTTRTARPRWVLAVWTALMVVAALFLAAGTASAATGPAAENRVRASASAAQTLDRPPQDVSADQRLGNTFPQPGIVVATGVATKTGCKGGACGIPGGTCFVAGTLILTEDGRNPIEEIEVGEKVWAKDLATGEAVLRVVDKTFVRHTAELVHLTVDGDTITTTAEHPFWVDGRGWVNAGDLKPGDVLVTPDGVATLDRKLVEQRPETVCNFRVTGLHNYYALDGDTPVLVHNANYLNTTESAGSLGGKYTPGQQTRDPSSQWYHEYLSNDELLDSINRAGDGDGILVSQNGTILGGHHRWDELLTRIDDGRIDADTPIRIDIFQGD